MRVNKNLTDFNLKSETDLKVVCALVLHTFISMNFVCACSYVYEWSNEWRAYEVMPFVQQKIIVLIGRQ